MASLSSTGSVSSSNSLGNTSLRGFGGLMSGIDRDSIIEQMTLGETTKINNVKNDITKLGWKQEAYRALSDQIIDITDKYTSYSSSSSLVDPLTFAKSIISTIGSENATRFVKASGSSDMINSISIEAVRQLATAATTRSDTVKTHALETALNDLDKETAISRLNYNGEGAKLTFGKHDGKGWYGNTTFTFPAQYKARDKDGNIMYDDNGNAIMKDIDYTIDLSDDANKKKLEDQLNWALEDSNVDLDGKKLSDRMEFKFDSEGKLKIEEIDGGMKGYGIQSSSSALYALGFTGRGKDGAVTIEDYNKSLQSFAKSSVYRMTVLESLTGAKVNFNYNGTQKEIELITAQDKADMNKITSDNILDYLKENNPDAWNELNVKLDAITLGSVQIDEEAIKKAVEEEILYEAGINRDDIEKSLQAEKDKLLEKVNEEDLKARMAAEIQVKRDEFDDDEAYNAALKDKADEIKRDGNADKIIKDDIKSRTSQGEMSDEEYEKKIDGIFEEKVAAAKYEEIKDEFQGLVNKKYADDKAAAIQEAHGNGKYDEKLRDAEKVAREAAVATEKEKAKYDAAQDAKMLIMQDRLQSRLDKAFGKGKIKVELDKDKDGILSFKTVNNDGSDSNVSLSITAGSSGGDTLKQMGIIAGESNKINLNGSLDKNKEAFGLTSEELEDLVKDGLTINGVKIDIDKDSSIGSILSKINASDAGVKATYIESTGQFMLVADEMGSDRTIDLGDENSLAFKIFGSKISENSQDGKDAIIDVSYGNGMTVTMNPSSNTFNLEGLTVTVSGVFGGDWKDTGKTDADGNKIQEWQADTSERVSFSAAADVDAVTEKVKTFFEDYNKLVTEVYNQLTTRSDSSYGPLTDEQKAEMSETSIENWETKAKQGILYNDSVIRDLNSTLEGFLTQLMGSGIKYQDLEKIGITYDESWGGGASTIVFNESKFRSAMETEPELVSDIFTGTGKTGGVGLAKTVENMFTPYATRIASKNRGSGSDKGSYGRLIEEAGSEKVPTSVMNNFIYDQIKEMNKKIETLQAQLKTKQERYIKQFTSMETLINQYNSQSSYLSNISG